MSRIISREELLIKLSSGNRPVLAEALPEKYYAARHLPGARHFPHDRVDALAPAVLPNKNAQIIVYCANRQCQNSHIAAHRLAALGYTDVSVYAGGKQDWEGAGLPFETSVAQAVTV